MISKTIRTNYLELFSAQLAIKFYILWSYIHPKKNAFVLIHEAILVIPYSVNNNDLSIKSVMSNEHKFLFLTLHIHVDGAIV